MPTMNLLAKIIPWLVSAMVTWVPLDSHHPANTAPSYDSIATTVARVTYDPTEAPVFTGDDGRAKTSLLILSIASLESFYDPKVESGAERGDSMESWCIMQIHLPKDATVRLAGDGFAYGGAGAWKGEDLIADRDRCVRVALHMIRVSFRACRDLRGYVAGTCVVDDPLFDDLKRKRIAQVIALASHRLNRAVSFFASHATPAHDAELLPSPAGGATP